MEVIILLGCPRKIISLGVGLTALEPNRDGAGDWAFEVVSCGHGMRPLCKDGVLTQFLSKLFWLKSRHATEHNVIVTLN